VTQKKDLSDQVIGDTAEGALDFNQNENNIIDSLFNDLLADVEE
jgi:hypothetical protein